LDDKVISELCKPCGDAIIIKLLGKLIGYVTMRERVKALWKLTGGFEMVDIGH